MHVLFITSWFETPSRPTAGKAVKDLAIALSQQGISVSILFQSSDQLPAQFKSGGIDIFHCHSTSVSKFYPVFNYWALKDLLNYFNHYICQKGKPDLIHVHSYSSLAIGVEIKKKYKIPFLYTEHSSQIAQQKMGFISRELIRYYLKACKATCAVSEYLRDAMLSINSDVKIIPNTINFNFFIPKERRNSNQLIMINLLTKNKQVNRGIEAYTSWKINQENAEMYIIGDGPEKSFLRRLAENENIHFLGEKKESDWMEILQSSACLLLMSKSETFGVVILEALACQIPVVCFDNGGVREIAKWIPSSSMLRIIDSSASGNTIAAAIDESIKNYSVDEAIRVRNTLKEKFNYTPVALQYTTVYNEILKFT